jgi:hypothetical protein
MRETVIVSQLAKEKGGTQPTIAGRLDVLANAIVAGTLLNERVLKVVSTDLDTGDGLNIPLRPSLRTWWRWHPGRGRGLSSLPLVPMKIITIMSHWLVIERRGIER